MRRASLAALTVLALLLAGCATIPTTGSVERGLTEAADDTGIVFLANKPAQGATQREIVTGFLTAASEGGDFHVAREYLTAKAKSAWKPRSRVLVQREQPEVTATSATELHLQVPISAQVDSDGTYTSSSDSVPLDFTLVQQNGQWRIDAAPNGIVLGQTVFQKVYTPQNLQYFDASYRNLVPDPRWFPISSNGTTSGSPNPATVIRALIAGPSGPLSSDVVTNPLDGAVLESVDVVDGGETTVSLTLAERNPSADLTARIEQQLAQSLGLRTPSALRLVVNGTEAPQATPRAEQASTVSAAYVVSDGKFGTLSASGAVTEERTLGKRIVAADPQAVTISVRQGLAAVQTDSGDVVAVTSGGTRTVDTRASLVAPSLDQQGWIFSVPRYSTDELIAVTKKGRKVSLDADLGGSTVQSIEVSPDGTRLLVLVQSATNGPRAYVAGIERDSDGTPIGLSDEHYSVGLGDSGGTGISATWADDATVAVVVGSTDGSTDRVWVQPLGRVGYQEGQLASTASIVGTSSTTDLRVRLQSGAIWIWATNTWKAEAREAVDVSVLAVQR